jgi:hypothetical protein
VLTLLLAAFALLGWLLVLADAAGLAAWAAVWALYLAAMSLAALGGGLRFRSVRVAALAAAGIVLTHGAYLGGFVRGVLDRPRRNVRRAGLSATGSRT